MNHLMKHAIGVALLGLSLTALADPLVAAHRGGTGDGPENTISTLQSSVKNGADILWMTVQVSSDGVPVLYRPADVSALTDAKGPVNTLTAEQLTALNAGYAYNVTDAAGNKTYPYRANPVNIPTLKAALRAVPASTPVIIDMKQYPAEALVAGVAKVIDEENAWQRVRFYSTDAKILALMAAHPQAQVFESRDATRERLARIALTGGACEAPPKAGTWAGIELERKVTVVEKFTLGEGVSEVVARWWTPEAMKCFKTNPDVHVMVFGIESPTAYRAAKQLGVDVVMTDSPIKMKTLKETVK